MSKRIRSHNFYVKGDGKTYQFRVKTNRYDRHSYIGFFNTSGKEEIIEIELREMEPGFRGMKPNIPDYPGKQMEEISFLIANKKAESFRLEIDKILLK
jgi:NADH dehydrogenase [ubiquinone] 1 alpha subcomplex assembly factor 1